MQKPYFLEPTLLPLVREYMDSHDSVDLDLLTNYLINNVWAFRNKKRKAMKCSVKSAYEWNKYEEEQQGLKQTTDTVPDIEADISIIESDSEDNTITMGPTESSTSHNTPSNTPRRRSLPPAAGASNGGTKKRSTGPRSELSTMTSNITLDEMKGIKYLEEKLSTVLNGMLLYPAMSISLLLSGPGQCGKSTLVDALAVHTKLMVFRIDLSRLVLQASPLASISKKLKEEIVCAREALPAIVHFQQVDALFPADSSNSSRQQNEMNDLGTAIANFIQECEAGSTAIDGKDTRRAIIIGETSRPELLEGPVSDCWTKKIVMRAPTAADRTDILQYLCERSNMSSLCELASVALKASSFVAGDLVKLVKQAGTIARDRAIMAATSATAGQFPPVMTAKYVTPSSLEVNEADFLSAVTLVTPMLKKQGFPAIPDTTWADIGGLEKIKKQLRSSILDPVINPEYFAKIGKKQSSGILLWGPPGCGKTLLAKAVANEAGVNLLVVNGPEVLSMYQGESERAIRTLFARAASVAPCVIFFDEFDSVCPNRSKTSGESGSKSTIVNTLLTQMDGFLSTPGIYFIAATNMPSILDPAALRPGRFDKKIYVDLPDAAGRLAVFKAATKNGTHPLLAKDVDLEAIAGRSECENYTGADCSHLVDVAIDHAIEEKKTFAVAQSSGSSGAEKDSFASVTINAFNKRPLDSDIDQPETKKLKHGDSVDSNSDETISEEERKFYPDGIYAIYKRHFEAALNEVTQSISDKELQKYEQMKVSMTESSI